MIEINKRLLNSLYHQTHISENVISKLLTNLNNAKTDDEKKHAYKHVKWHLLRGLSKNSSDIDNSLKNNSNLPYTVNVKANNCYILLWVYDETWDDETARIEICEDSFSGSFSRIDDNGTGDYVYIDVIPKSTDYLLTEDSYLYENTFSYPTILDGKEHTWYAVFDSDQEYPEVQDEYNITCNTISIDDIINSITSQVALSVVDEPYTISFDKGTMTDSRLLFVSNDKENWRKWDYENEEITVDNDNPLYIAGYNPKKFGVQWVYTGNWCYQGYPNISCTGKRTDKTVGYRFLFNKSGNTSGHVKLTGDLMDLIDCTHKCKKLPAHAFCGMFSKDYTLQNKWPNEYSVTINAAAQNPWYNASVGPATWKTLGIEWFENEDNLPGSYLVDASDLTCSADNLSTGCFNFMFGRQHMLKNVNTQLISKYKTIPGLACFAMFLNCFSLENPLVFNSTAKLSGTANLAFMYYGCLHLQTAGTLPFVDIPTRGLHYIFGNCWSLTETANTNSVLKLGTAEQTGSTYDIYNNIQGMYNGCVNLTLIKPFIIQKYSAKFATPWAPSNGIFSNCHSLTNIDYLGDDNYIYGKNSAWCVGVNNYGTVGNCDNVTHLRYVASQNWSYPNTINKKLAVMELTNTASMVSGFPNLVSLTLDFEAICGGWRNCINFWKAIEYHGLEEQIGENEINAFLRYECARRWTGLVTPKDVENFTVHLRKDSWKSACLPWKDHNYEGYACFVEWDSAEQFVEAIGTGTYPCYDLNFTEKNGHIEFTHIDSKTGLPKLINEQKTNKLLGCKIEIFE